MSTDPPDGTTDAPLDETLTPGRRTSESSDRWRERIASAAVGGTLLVFGIRRRSIGGAAAALAGGWLLYRGIAGNSSLRPGARHRESSTGRESSAGRESSTGRESAAGRESTETSRSVTVGKAADELYERWRDPETMTRVLGEYVDVTAASEERWRWTVNGPLRRSVTWDSRIVEDRPGELLRWESLDGDRSAIECSVRLRQAPADRGTEVTLRFSFDPPGGALGETVATRLGIVPGTLAEKALDRFKSLAETGEIPTLERNPSARGKGDLL